MTTLTNETVCGCVSSLDPVNWYGVTGGKVSLSPTGNSADDATWQLVASVPFGTGSSPLVTGTYGLVWISFIAKSATAGHFGIINRKFLSGISGASSPSSYTQSLPGSVSGKELESDLEFYAPDGLSNYVQIISGLNSSGDLDVHLVCKSTDGHSATGVAWDISDLKIEYQVIGSV